MFRFACMVLLTALLAPLSTDCKECQTRYRDKIAVCDKLFNSSGSTYYHDTQWHKQCLEEAKNEFDNCLSTCK